jgi:hypothetical protein
MTLLEDSLDETRNKTLLIKKDCNKNKQLEEKMLKTSCLVEKLTVRIRPIEELLDLDKHEMMETEVASPAKALPVAQSTLSKTKIARFTPLNESTISGEETQKTVNNTSLRSGDEIPLNFTSMSSKQKWNWLLTIPKNELKNQDWDAFHDLVDYNPARGFEEAAEIINIDDNEEQLYRKLLFKHKMFILKSRC